LVWAREAKSATIVSKTPEYKKDDGPLTDEQIDQIKESVRKPRPRSNRPGTYRATTKKSAPVQEEEIITIPPGEFVGVPAEPDPDLLLEKAKPAAKVTMPTFN